MNIAVVLAGGSGARLGDTTPKQFLKVAGKKIIEHTIDVFENHKDIDEICVVTRADYLGAVEELVLLNEYKKVRKILSGGSERYESSLAAINAYTNDAYNLIFHDAVRPLVNSRIVSDCIEALEKYDAVDVAIATTDTIVAVNNSNCIDHIPDRSCLRNGQTPQCFKRGVIRKAYEKALVDPGFKTTDDCGVVKAYMPEVDLFIVEGEVFNMKLTYIEDLFLLDKLFQLKTIADVKELSDDTVQLMKDKVVVVFGGSYGIGEEVVKLCEQHTAKVYSFSRTQNNVDVASYSAVEESLRSVYEQCGRIDSVICSAGILRKEPLASMSNETILDSVHVNYLGAVNVAKASYSYLSKTKGALLLYTSSSYTKGRMMYSIYSSTKAAIVNLVQALSEEWFYAGVRVNCINPERTKTPMRTTNFGNEPEGSLLDPRDVAVASINTVFSDFTGEVVDVKR